MTGSYFGDAGVFLVGTIFGFYIAILMLRILLQLVRANFFNPICQFIVKVTNPPLMLLRRAIPNWGRLDLAAILFMVILKALEMFIIWKIQGVPFGPLKALTMSPFMLLDFTILVILVVIVIKVILSWVSPYGDNPINPLLFQLSAPILVPMGRVIPPLGGMDFSPWVAIICLQLTRMLIARPLIDLATSF